MEGMEGVARAALVVCAIALSAAIATACGSSDAKVTESPEVAFAPLVRLHDEETLLPMNAPEFLDRAALRWADDQGCGDATVAVGRLLTAERTRVVDFLWVPGLNSDRAYSRTPKDGECAYRFDLNVHTNERNRPYDSGPDRIKGLRPAEGFYLDLVDGSRDGGDNPNAAPAYVERRRVRVGGEPALRISYWMLYGANEPYRAGKAGDALRHEGDWERVDVTVRRDGDSYVPLSLRLHANGEVREVPWRSVDVVGDTHPVLYAARGTHTAYLAAVRHRRTVALGDGRQATVTEETRCDDCVEWRTWTLVRKAAKQPWYGFGGAWGEIGTSDLTTGPLGPHDGWWDWSS